MKNNIHPIFRTWINLLSVLLFVALPIICLAQAEAHAQKISMETENLLENSISQVAHHYIGIPYKFGADPDEAGAADNSHLLCSIYEDAAEITGIRFAGYMPMRMLLRNLVEIRQDMVKNGDLMVLNDGHAAMIYNMEGSEHFDLIYASLKRQEVISFNSRNVVFEAYWRSNLKGYFRLKEELFSQAE